MTALKQAIRSYYNTLKPFIDMDLIKPWSCAPVKSLVNALEKHDLKVTYIEGAKIVTIEGEPITLITGTMNRTHGSVYCAPDDGNYYVPYSVLIETLAKLLGAGRKEAPFIEPLPISKFLMEWYWKKLDELVSED